jgi:hypothetical protein
MRFFIEECVDDGSGIYHFYRRSSPLPEQDARERAKTYHLQYGGWLEVNSEKAVKSRIVLKKKLTPRRHP